jgi:hypothetical protein
MLKKYQAALRNLLDIRSKTDFVDGMIGFLYEMCLNDISRAESIISRQLPRAIPA